MNGDAIVITHERLTTEEMAEYEPENEPGTAYISNVPSCKDESITFINKAHQRFKIKEIKISESTDKIVFRIK